MASIGDAAQDIVGTMRGLIGLSRSGRLREQLEHTLAIYERTQAIDELARVRSDLVDVLSHQSAALKQHVDPSANTGRDWLVWLMILTIIVTPIACLSYLGYRWTDDHWWAWLWTIVAGLFALLLFIASFSALDPKDKASR